MFKDRKVKSLYPQHAEHAAVLESNGAFSEAAFAWTVALQHARKLENQHWAEARADFCDTWAARYQGVKAA
ncbi:ANR family transcriptional regulator [Vibrio scophthalmi]|uniref:ANR family transcriptional regulator n=1 Tax=Vibrio scophthalmi TaxID=45658 RepID=A0A1E3WPM9_9VIBR|nr:ANR family transcriptional regulator [Vibrio scophthalmi]ODS10952.1 hypothetical protein VSF3289_01213 [Vibrio scophthalmi]